MTTMPTTCHWEKPIDKRCHRDSNNLSCSRIVNNTPHIFICLYANQLAHISCNGERMNQRWLGGLRNPHSPKKQEANGLHHATSSTIYNPNSLRNIERKKSIDLAENWSGKNGITHHCDYYVLDNKLRL